MFPSLKQDGKKPVLNARTESGPGKECTRMLGRLLFPDFYGKNPVSGKCHSGMQTSTSQPNININYAVIYSINFDRFFKKRLNKTWQKIFWFKISKKKMLIASQPKFDALEMRGKVMRNFGYQFYKKLQRHIFTI